METVIVGLKNSEARKLLIDLADLGLIEIKDSTDLKQPYQKLSDLKNQLTTKMNEQEINAKLEELRKEWQRDI